MKRRDFLHSTMLGSLAPIFMNGLPLNAMGKLSSLAQEDDKILVIIELNGGNDGLNTVIPVDQYANYQKNRENIAIPENSLLRIPQADNIGLHPALKGIHSLFNEGKAALIHDVGYPDPNFSHFRSMDIWNTASDSDEQLTSGWTGRYLSNLHPDYPNNYPNKDLPDPLAIQVGSLLNTSLQGTVYPMGITLQDPNFFYEILTEDNAINPNTIAGKELNYLRQVANQTNEYGKVIQAANERVGTQVDYPETWLAYQMKVVAKMILGGLKTKFYFVRLGGFDTHSEQVDPEDTEVGQHAKILSELDGAVSTFLKDLKQANKTENVMAITYSEFGRRIKSNGSTGTDHGAAAPMFVFGDQVNSRVFGNTPIINSVHDKEDSVPMQYDFRSVYSSLLENWFCADGSISNEVMLQSFQTLPIVSAGACGGILSSDFKESEVLFKAFPNPIQDTTWLEFESKGGLNYIVIFNSRGQQIMTVCEKILPKGPQKLSFNSSHLSKGLYFARWQNEYEQKVIKLVK